jgi:lipopolysaccharide/colanic/teichoic acid biosynthesis glycosyltransferase
MPDTATNLLLPLTRPLSLPALRGSVPAEHVEATPGYLAWKPLLDAVLAAFLLVLLTPIVLLAAVLVRLTSRGPAFYTQQRVGRGGRTFTIYKLRTMYLDCEAATGAVWCKKGVPRVTPLGRLLRATHVVEFPQLLNVLFGDMSLCGPRPERPEIVEYLKTKLDGYAERLDVRPGITGLAQVQLPPDTCLDEVQQKLVCDCYYIDNLDAGLDLRIMICTGLFLAGVPLRLSRRWLGIPEPLAN